MEDRELQKAYDAIAQSLRDIRCDWILEQVEDELRFGRLELKSVETSTSTVESSVATPNAIPYEGEKGHRGRSRKAQFVGTEDYTPVERLRLLIDAVERGIPDVAEMEENADSFLRENGATDVVLVNEEEQRSVPNRELAPNSERSRAASHLRALLQELRKEVG